jgi:hypothetical protein
MAMDPNTIAQLSRQAGEDQREATLRDYLACEEAWRRWPLVALIVGRSPRGADWRRYEALRAASRAPLT